jgi:hypothetical protein
VGDYNLQILTNSSNIGEVIKCPLGSYKKSSLEIDCWSKGEFYVNPDLFYIEYIDAPNEFRIQKTKFESDNKLSSMRTIKMRNNLLSFDIISWSD